MMKNSNSYNVKITFKLQTFQKDIFGDYWEDKWVDNSFVDKELVINNLNSGMLEVFNKITYATEKLIKEGHRAIRVDSVDFISLN